MTWVRIDDQLPDHPKLARISARIVPHAGWLHVCALCYCSRHLTDGFVPDGIIPRLVTFGTQQSLAALQESGLWERTDGGYLLHDYLEYQPSREQVQAQRAALHSKRSDAGRKGGLARAKAQVDPSKQANAKQTRSPIPSHPKELKDLAMKKGEEYSEDFEDFWKVFPPERGGKYDAYRAYKKRLKSRSPAELLSAAKSYARARANEDARYTKRASSWLNAHMDEDAYLEPDEDKEALRWR